MKFSKAFVFIFLCVVPSCMLLLGFFMDRLPYFYDPEYVYLFNGVNILFSQKISHIDHPGTPLQLIYAIIIKVRFYFFKEFSDFDKDIIMNSEKYITAVNRVLLVFQSIIVFWLGIVTYKLYKNIWLSIIIQMSNFYFTLNSYIMATRAMTENLLMIGCLLFIIYLLKLVNLIEKGDRNKRILKYIILLSIVTGFGIATKFVFLFLIIIPILIIPKVCNKFVYLLGCILSFLIFTFPIRHQYILLFNWLKTLLFHKGIYGKGETGFIDLSVYFNNFKFIFTSNPHVFFILSVSLFFLIFISFGYKNFNKTIQRKYLLYMSVFLFTFISLMIVSKHFDPGHVHYLVIPFSMLGLLCFSLIDLVKSIFRRKRFLNLFITPLIALVFIGYTTYDIYITNKNSYYFYLSLKYENDIVNDLIAKNPDCIHIYNYGWNFNQMTALTFEFQHSNYLHAKMMELFPNTYYFNFLFYPERFSNWFTEVDIHQVLKKNNNKALIIGAQILDVHQQSLIKNHLKIEPIHISPNPYVYNSLYYLKEDGGL